MKERIKVRILVVDGQGGGVGKAVVERIKREYPMLDVMAVGTNVSATAAMLKAGANHGATGENAVIVGCRNADIIVGPVGIVIADSLFGEITPKMALAVSQSSAKRILIPMNLCDNYIAGVGATSTSALIDDCMAKIGEIISKNA